MTIAFKPMNAEYLDHMGDDLSVVNAARVSFDKESKWVDAASNQPVGKDWDIFGNPLFHLSEADAGLIRFLSRHNHWTPFAHTAIKLRMTAPLPIRTQCFKHKQGFVENEQSRRYIASTPDLFVPDVFRAAPTGGAKQGSSGQHPRSDSWRDRYILQCQSAITLYEEMVADGVCPEQARFVLPQGVLVQWVWTGSLAAYARFYRQRMDPHAQTEVQDLAQMVGNIIEPLFPISWSALVEELV